MRVSTSKLGRLWLLLLPLLEIIGLTLGHDVPCPFNAMCLCWVQDDTDFTKMDVSCTGVPFARFPDVTISFVAQLDVAGSGLQVFDNEALASATGVEGLGLMSNQLVSMGDKSLVRVSESLRSLDLSYNALEEVPLTALRALRKLTWLNMHSNHLTSLEGDWGQLSETLSNAFFGDNSIASLPRLFASFRSLVWLNLDGNNLEQLDEESLPPNLQTLSLNGNLLKAFPASLARLGDLVWLYLRANDIRHLEFPDFAGDGLEMVDLSENSIQSISYATLDPPDKRILIEDLNLSGNRLTTLSAGTLSHVAMRRLHLSSNGLQRIEDEALLGLEDGLEYLNLENNELADLPEAVSSLRALSYLYLANNALRELRNDSLGEFGVRLKALSLASNGFQALPSKALVSCTELLHLNLGYNKIHRLLPGDLDWASSLEILLLRNNILTHLKPHTFRGADKLKELSLSFNHLTEISEEAFSGLDDSLEILELSFAFSTDVFPQRALRPLKALHWLVLDNNNFASLESAAFYSHSQLRYVNLESNRLHYLPERLFMSELHPELRDVKLGYNLLEALPDDTFHNLTELRALDLTGNRLARLEPASIVHCPKLVSVSLANNRIAHVDNAAFQGLSGLRFLHLEFNKLTKLDFQAFADSGAPDFSLNVSYNSISMLFPSRSQMPNLTRLDLGFNNLTHLPTDIFGNTPQLRTINLQNNFLTTIEPGIFALKSLATLSLRDNRLESLRRQSFGGQLEGLQQLDLSGNALSQLTNEQFRQLRSLRVLNLARNRLRSLSRDVFTGTRLEILDLNRNKFTVAPSASFSDVEYTLRSIDLSENYIDHVDGPSFPTPQLTWLSLAQNRIRILPDNSFMSLSKLLSLNMSYNDQLLANFKEVFHYLPELRLLGLASCGLERMPHLLLPSLSHLDLSGNRMNGLAESEQRHLDRLKVLLVANNSLSSIDGLRLALLRQLDISANPIKELTKQSFVGFPRLERLNMRDLSHTQSVSVDSLRSLRYLKHLRTQTWPATNGPNNGAGFELRDLVAGLPLRSVELEVSEPQLSDQLHGAFGKQLRELTITGQNLRQIGASAFATIESPELVLRIRDTRVQKLQPDIFGSLGRRMAQLTLDLRNNHINELSPAVIYGNASWESVGTNLVAGGLQLSGNPLECDCEIAWLSLWLRRWLRESRQIHTASQSDARQLRSLAGRALCSASAEQNSVYLPLGDDSSQQQFQLSHLSQDRALLNLGGPNTACHASALSSAPGRVAAGLLAPLAALALLAR
ncbi:hypothetical protein QAD02_017343 [Eretmocerus hayati]|uniref:Uncharacterized protein n=1 Tax=Eretmocerus hayati TaxID=131215 RepID=A0ACC2PFE9_9HYME|nr:hypothetical protein QAD02_017343 [Eretmocerus hayati]